MEGFIAVCATAKGWEALVPNKRANNGLAGDTYANEGVPRESILGCAHNKWFANLSSQSALLLSALTITQRSSIFQLFGRSP